MITHLLGTSRNLMVEALMAANKHGTSGFIYDPHCEGCQADGCSVEAFGFCEDCNTFLCQGCHKVHSWLPCARDHTVRKGKDMPKCLKEKPVKYPPCSTYVGQLNDKFCLCHQEMVCEKCTDESHKSCHVGNITDICDRFDAIAHERIIGKMGNIRKNIETIMASVQTNVEKIENKRHNILEEAQHLFDKTISVVEKLHTDIKTDIDHLCQNETRAFREQLTQLSTIDDKISTLEDDMKSVKRENMDPKMFIAYQQALNTYKASLQKLETIYNDLKEIDISFTAEGNFQEFLSKCSKMGKINVEARNLLNPDNIKKIFYIDLVFTEICFR